MVYQFNNNQTRISEFVPPAETAVEWASKLTVESHAELAGTDPIEIQMAEIKRLQENCDFVQHFNLFSGLENDYPTSVRLAMCGNNKLVGRGEVAITKAIQGQDYLYVIRISRKVPSFEIGEAEIEREAVATWSAYLAQVKLCNPEAEAHPCTDVR